MHVNMCMHGQNVHVCKCVCKHAYVCGWMDDAWLMFMYMYMYTYAYMHSTHTHTHTHTTTCIWRPIKKKARLAWIKGKMRL